MFVHLFNHVLLQFRINHDYLLSFFITTTMSTAPLKIFDAYDMQIPRSDFDRDRIQETVDYCECRFRCILLLFPAAGTRQMILQRALFSELVNIISLNYYNS